MPDDDTTTTKHPMEPSAVQSLIVTLEAVLRDARACRQMLADGDHRMRDWVRQLKAMLADDGEHGFRNRVVEALGYHAHAAEVTSDRICDSYAIEGGCDRVYGLTQIIDNLRNNAFLRPQGAPNQ